MAGFRCIPPQQTNHELFYSDAGIFILDEVFEVIDCIFSGCYFAVQEFCEVLLQTFVAELVILSNILELDVLGEFSEDCCIVLTAEEFVTECRIRCILVVDLLVVGELDGGIR